MKRPLKVPRSQPHACSPGWTLPDLLAVLAVCGLLGLMLLPAWAGSRTRVQNLRCLDNLRHVMGAMLLYTHDNHDLLPPNPDDGTTLPGYTWCAGMAYGGMPGDPPGPATFNPDILADPSRCLVAPYLQGNVTVFRCTADPRVGLYQGTNAALVGTTVPAARTLSLSGAVGTVDAQFAKNGSSHSGVPNLPVNGAWLTGQRTGNTYNNPWRTYGKLSDLVIPAPVNLLLVAEEDPFSINDGFFATSVALPQWVDYPSTLHNDGCVFSFGDGHADLHNWASSTTRLTGPATSIRSVSGSDPDWNWVAQHTTARY